MYYINKEAAENGSHGNPQSNKTALTVELPDELLSVYLETMGFANIIIEDGKVTSVSVNQDALDKYSNENPEKPIEEQVTDDEWFESQILYTAMMTDTLLEV